MDDAVCEIASQRSLPYFRAQHFAETVKRVSADVAYLFQTKSLPMAVTASGTGLMEMAVTNLLDPGDTAVVINGGTFGSRWADLCRTFQVNVSELKVEWGKTPDFNTLDELLKPGVNAVFVNMHETSTGYLYDIEQMGRLVRSRGALFVVDAISAIGADEFKMDDWLIDCALVSTQKALALMPGLGYIAFSDRAMERVGQVKRGRYYFNAADYARNLERGMTPFTPAIVALLQMEERMRQIKEAGLDRWVERHANLASSFRARWVDPSKGRGIFPERCSNAMTSIALPEGITATGIITYMQDKYDWWFAPNGTQTNHYLRVSHMGDLSQEVMELAAIRLTEAVGHLSKGHHA